jgi:hypothetical protein
VEFINIIAPIATKNIPARQEDTYVKDIKSILEISKLETTHRVLQNIYWTVNGPSRGHINARNVTMKGYMNAIGNIPIYTEDKNNNHMITIQAMYV